MSSNQKSIFTPARVMCLFAFLVLLVACIMSFNHPPSHFNVFPYPKVTIFVINTISALICAVLVIFPSSWKAQCLLLFIQSITTTLTGYETLGTFLYAALIILLFVNGFFKTRLKEKIAAFCIIWAAVLAGYGIYAIMNEGIDVTNEINQISPTHEQIVSNGLHRGLFRFFLEVAISIFFFGFYYYVYKKIESLLVTLVPAKNVRNSNIKLPANGSELHLSEYGLSERQSKLVLEYLSSQKNYEALGEQFYISKSTVKKDMTEVFEKFGVTNLKELHILLLQFIVKA